MGHVLHPHPHTPNRPIKNSGICPNAPARPNKAEVEAVGAKTEVTEAVREVTELEAEAEPEPTEPEAEPVLDFNAGLKRVIEEENGFETTTKILKRK